MEKLQEERKEKDHQKEEIINRVSRRQTQKKEKISGKPIGRQEEDQEEGEKGEKEGEDLEEGEGDEKEEEEDDDDDDDKCSVLFQHPCDIKQYLCIYHSIRHPFSKPHILPSHRFPHHGCLFLLHMQYIFHQ